MTTRDNDQEPDDIRRRAAGVHIGEALPAGGALCALAIGLMVLMPGIASEARRAPPATPATFRACTPALLPDDGETWLEPGKPSAPQPACGAPARTMRLVEEASRPGAGSQRLH
ncbi:hypothetical protein V5F63_00310 [Xanthobacter autotrophicus DSM 597]|uniref:hypothetical protein n=1 Tax=Xanthobacter wiegelii TaxID=3119913 RepID=UPI003726FDFD